jgi:hypothetical protein
VSEIRTDITKLSANLLPSTVAALNAAVEEAGDTATDTVNRAIQLYAEIMRLHAKGRGWGRFTFHTDPPKACRIEINRPWWRFW